MRVLTLVALLTLCSAQGNIVSDIFLEIVRNLNKLKDDHTLTTLNHSSQIQSMLKTYHCVCEGVFVDHLMQSVKSVKSSTHKNNLSNILDLLDHLHLHDNMRNLGINCTKSVNIVERKRSRTIKTHLIDYNIDFIKKWNYNNCQKNSTITVKEKKN